jgi:hypothetical protein
VTCHLEGCDRTVHAKRMCKLHYDRWYRAANRSQYRARKRRRYERQTEAQRAADLKRGRQQRFNKRVSVQIAKVGGCERCGLTLIPFRQLHFHHRPGEDKVAPVSRLISRNASLDRIQAEIDKCEVLCDHCHATHHYIERGGIPYQGGNPLPLH